MVAAGWGAIIGGIAGGVSSGITSYMTNKKVSKAYKDYADDIREAADRYSGKNADTAMRAEGERQAQQMQNSFGAKNQVNTSNLSTQNAIRNTDGAIGNNQRMEGQQLGRDVKATQLNAAYNAAAQNAKNRFDKQTNKAKVAANTVNAFLNPIGDAANIGYQFSNNASDDTSDERAKTSINNNSGLPESDIEDSLRQLETVSYKYKDPNVPGCDDEIHESGFTAQSLEKTPLGKDVVKEGKDGIKRIDSWKLMEALTAGIAQLQREIDDLEKKNA